MRLISSLVLGLGLTVVSPAAAQPAVEARDLGLKIVVIEGQGAVNIIQQKTAVAPVVEVRDRNNLPVPGAVVTFSVGGNSASFAGAQTISITTNAAGRAAASSFSPLTSGSVQIQVSAAFQGQTAAATIAQTNVMTAAQAAGAAGATSGSGAGSGSGGASAGAAGGGGGGLSGTTIGIVGAAVAGGALAATQVGGATGDDKQSRATYVGTVSGQITVVTTSGNLTCTSTRSLTGTIRVTVEQNPNGTVTGSGSTDGTQTEVERTASCSNLATVPFNYGGDLSGSASSFGFSHRTSGTGDTTTSVNDFTFTGSLSGGVVIGTIAFTQTMAGEGTGVNVINGRGTTTFAVTLRPGS